MPGVFAVRTGEAAARRSSSKRVGSLGKQVGQRVGHGVERVAGDAAPGRDVDGDARGVPRQPVDLAVDVAPFDPVERVFARPRSWTGQVRMLEFSREMIV